MTAYVHRARRSGPTPKQFLTVQARGILAVDFIHMDAVLVQRSYALQTQISALQTQVSSMISGYRLIA